MNEPIKVAVSHIMQALAFLQLPMTQRNDLARAALTADVKPPWLDDHVWMAAEYQGWIRRVGGPRSARQNRRAGEIISTNPQGRRTVVEISKKGVEQLRAWKEAHPVVEGS